MNEFLECKKTVISLFDEAIEFAKKTGYDEIITNIDKNREKLNKSELVIVVCGEIKRGKSSLLTALLEEKDLFPIDVNVATNIVTIARYGEKETIEIVLENNGNYETKYITRDEIAQYATEQGNRGNTKKVKCLHIKTPNPKLKNGLVFVDTPGVGSINLEHSEVTYGYLPNADVVLFVSDALSPLTESELKFLQTATKFCNNLIFPLTKIDKASNYKEIYESNLEKIHQYTSKRKEEIQIVPVSSLAKLRYLETKNPMMLKSSNYKSLENLIWTTVNNKRAQILFTPPLISLTKELLAIKNNLKIQIGSLTQDSNLTKQLEANLRKTTEDKIKLLEDSAEWKGQLQYDLSKVFENSLEAIQDKQYDLQEILNERLKNPSILQNLNELTAEINKELFGVTYYCKNNILESVEKIINDTEKKLGLLISVDNNLVSKIDFDEKDPIPGDIPRKNNIDKSIMLGRNIAMSGGGGGAFGGVAGGIIGAGIGFLIGGPAGALMGAQYGGSVCATIGSAIGGGKGILEGIKQIKTSDIPQISKIYSTYINKELANIKNAVMKVKNDLIYAIVNDLNSKIKAQKNSLEKDIKDIQQNVTLSKTEAAKKANDIKILSGTLNNLEVKINKLMKFINERAQSNINSQRKNENKAENPSPQVSKSSSKFSFLEF